MQILSASQYFLFYKKLLSASRSKQIMKNHEVNNNKKLWNKQHIYVDDKWKTRAQ